MFKAFRFETWQIETKLERCNLKILNGNFLGLRHYVFLILFVGFLQAASTRIEQLVDPKRLGTSPVMPRRVLPVLPKDALAKFLHGSSNFFLRP